MSLVKQCSSQNFQAETTTSSNPSKFLKKSKKPRIHKKRIFGGKKEAGKQRFNSSLWTIAENEAYMNFLVLNSELFTLSKLGRRDAKINVLMSEAIKSRSADQCRSHHQKMMKYHEDIPTIIRHIIGLRQNQDQNQSINTGSSSGLSQPVLQDFLEYDRPFEDESFCEELMNLDLEFF